MRVKANHSIAWIFFFQTLISTTPGILVTLSLPFLCNRLGQDLAFAGLILLSQRVASIVTDYFVPKMLQRLAPHLLSIIGESIQLISIGIILFSLLINSPVLLFVGFFIRGINASLILGARFSWLKHCDLGLLGDKITSLTTALWNGSTVIAGVLFIASPALFGSNTLLYVDAVTSVIGLTFFWLLRSLGVDALAGAAQKTFAGLLIFTPKYIDLTLLSFALYFGLSGTTVLLYEYGEKFLPTYGGYGTSLIFYGSCFWIIGLVSKFDLFQNRIIKGEIVAYSLAMLAMVWFSFAWRGAPPWMFLLSIAAIFLIYAYSFTAMQVLWFRRAGKDDVSKIYALNAIYSSVLLGFGEYVYALIEHDYWIRALSIMFFLLLAKVYKTNSTQP